MPRKNNNSEKASYPTSKYDIKNASVSGPPPPTPTSTPTPPTNTSIWGSLYSNVIAGLGFGVGSSLGREIINKNLSSTSPNVGSTTAPSENMFIFTSNIHFNEKNPCHREYKEYEEAVSHYLHYNDFSVEEFHKKYLNCLEKNYGNHSKKINLLSH